MAEKLIIAKSAANAASLKNGSSAFLAGGTEDNRLNSTVEVKTLISIGRLKELDGISPAPKSFGCQAGDKAADKASRKVSYIKIGAMSTFQEIIDSTIVPEFLKEACRFMGSRTKRNMATIGGNVALRRTDSYLYATLLACHAKLELMDGAGKTDVRCVNFYLKNYDELKDCIITAVYVPGGKDVVVVSKRYANTVQSHAVLTVAMGCCRGKLRIGVAAKDTALTALPDIAEALGSKSLSDEEILSMVSDEPELAFKKDIYGSPEYKRYLLSVTIADLAKKVMGGCK